MIGRAFAGYRITDVIGEGAMGAVYRAERSGSPEPVALKVVHRSMIEHATAVARFEREARTIARLQHPGCVRLLDWGTERGIPYMALELVEGSELSDVLDAEGPLPLGDALAIGVQVCDVLRAAHELGIVHRDLKPENIMLLAASAPGAPRIKILDFGVAKLVGPARADGSAPGFQESLTHLGALVGTPTHMAPELVRGGELDGRVDIYAFGVLLYELCTGQLPFEDANPLRLALRHIDEPPAAPSELVPELPAEVETIILHCLEKSPDDRPQSADEVGQALAALAAALGEPV
jgi:serine/threonine-protein kinase